MFEQRRRARFAGHKALATSRGCPAVVELTLTQRHSCGGGAQAVFLEARIPTSTTMVLLGRNHLGLGAQGGNN
jgi:hypothetical protein